MSDTPLIKFTNLAHRVEMLVKIYNSPTFSCDLPHQIPEDLERKLLHALALQFQEIDHSISHLKTLLISKKIQTKLDLLNNYWIPFKEELSQKYKDPNSFFSQKETSNLLRKAIYEVKRSLQSEPMKKEDLLQTSDRIHHKIIQITGEIEALELEIRDIEGENTSSEKKQKISDKKTRIAKLSLQLENTKNAFSELFQAQSNSKLSI